jgi:hypothetical protein
MTETQSKNQQSLTRLNPATPRDSFFRVVIILAGMLLASGLDAQGVRGTVFDAVSRNPVAGALVQLYVGDAAVAVTKTEATGMFILPFDRAGRVRLIIEADGYMPAVVPDILLDGYAVVTIDQGVTPWTISLNEVAVVGRRTSGTPYMARIRTDDLMRIAGHYDDPVRVAHSLPGVVLTNDQANHFSFRGQSPVMNTWMVEGLEVVNPNHLNNAGTFSDRPSLSGGGVNLFSAQALEATDLHTGLAPIGIGRNAGAVIDQHLRESAEPEWRIKAGLIGFEGGGTAWLTPSLAIDGNLRYSFTGVLTGLGADFGGERIGFYDGVYSLRWSGPKDKLKIFGWAGRSDTDFDMVEDPRERMRYKDFFDIRYDNAVIGQGLTYLHTIDPAFSIKAGGSWSGLNADYTRNGTFGTTAIMDSATVRQQVVSAFVETASRVSPALAWKAGIGYLYRDMGDDPASITPFLAESTLRPYGEVNMRLSESLTLEGAAEVVHDIPDNAWLPGGSLRLDWQPGSVFEGWIGSRFGTGQRVRTYDQAGDAAMLRVWNSQAGMRVLAGNHAFVQNIFLHRTTDMAMAILAEGFSHMADYGDGTWPSLAFLGASGYSTQWGWEGTWRFTGPRNLSFEVNQTFLKSLRTIGEGIDQESGRYATGYATHIMAAKEFFGRRKDKERTWQVSVRALIHGGLREPMIDEAASEAALATVYTDPYSYTERLQAYSRVDLTLTRTIAGPRLRLRIALDIQNVLNLENAAFRYYDPFLRSVETQAQLGIIPILSVQLSGTGRR